jgi:hypothetical protein
MNPLIVMALVAATTPARPGSRGEPEIEPSVEYATSWEAAIDEARLLNLPLVVHSHGFY